MELEAEDSDNDDKEGEEESSSSDEDDDSSRNQQDFDYQQVDHEKFGQTADRSMGDDFDAMDADSFDDRSITN